MNCLVLAAVVVIGAYLEQSVAVANVSERVSVGSKHGTQWHRVGPLDAAVVVALGNVEGKEGGWEGNEARHVVDVELELDIQGVAQCKVLAINLCGSGLLVVAVNALWCAGCVVWGCN